MSCCADGLALGSAISKGTDFLGGAATDTLAEWLRRRPAKPMGSPRVGSNPTGVVLAQTKLSRDLFARSLQRGRRMSPRHRARRVGQHSVSLCGRGGGSGCVRGGGRGGGQGGVSYHGEVCGGSKARRAGTEMARAWWWVGGGSLAEVERLVADEGV